MTDIEGFPPIAAKTARVLILGSMPGEASLRKMQYYGHPHNAFWRIMGELFGAHPGVEYQMRKKILMAHGIAVWDVLGKCRRKGSMDVAILKDSIQTNDFFTFFAAHREIRHVFFNGGTAERIYKKSVLPVLGNRFGYLRYSRLPSTSPAYASMKPKEKIRAWRAVADVLTGA
ncbi:MAG: DNA-deoxyinosine glycosylase [Gammaproteobacteria bacterium]